MPGSIVIAGTGPGDPGALTRAVSDACDRAGRIILRTAVHPFLNISGDPRCESCDDLYNALPTFDEVYAAVVERVVAAAKAAAGEVVYAVPGHPSFGERTVPMLIARAREEGIAVRVLPAVSCVDAVVAAVGADPMAEGLQVLDGLDLQTIAEAEPFSGGQLAVDPTRPLLVTQVYDQRAAAGVKLRLARTYPDDHPITIVTAAGVPELERLTPCALFQLDRLPVDHLTSVWVPPIADLTASRSPATLQRISARLRREDGCPWDRKQTHASLRGAVIEEAYEVVDAIDGGDPDELAEELGDLLLQVALHSQIAEEAGEFMLEDVYDHINRKLVRRHPHVFGDAVANTPGEVVQTWDAVKARERADSGKADRPRHPLDRLPRSMPALQRATVLIGPRKGDRESDGSPGALAAAGATILAAVEAALAAGVDPEQALNHVLRLRFAPPPESSEGTVS